MIFLQARWLWLDHTLHGPGTGSPVWIQVLQRGLELSKPSRRLNVAMARILGAPRNRRARHGPRAVGAADDTSGTAVARGFGRATARWRPTRARRGGQELAGRLSTTSFERRRW